MGLKTHLLLVLFAILIAVYINYPGPNPSEKLKRWENRGKYFTFEGHKIFYRDDKGTKLDGAVLLCLHGFPTMSYDWDKIWSPLLSQFSRVIAPDYLGYGFSDKPLDHNYTISESADMVESLLAKLDVTTTHILAHDVGDTVALELIARFNERTDPLVKDTYLNLLSVTLLNGGIFPETNFPRLLQRALLTPFAPVLCRLSNYYTFKKSFGEVFGPYTQPTTEEFTDFWAGVTHNYGHRVMPGLLDYINQRSYNKARWVGALQHAHCPVHTIYGPGDPVNPPVFVDHYKAVVPNPFITVLGQRIGHYPQWEDPRGTVSAYLKFLSTIS